ncbi:DUF4097 family beta strand repeat-containing protein [Halolamina sediminis]|uniref:DUF4097 family beta strand repeat-containing protein n=1 Tax=Halolamina sediminis TaxID=1480675 RepID=UPI0019299C27|nr:DUF4097 family beta strand repeat-containing protein [Halolamina sediminis]
MTRSPTRRRLLGGVGAALVAGLAGCTGATPFVGKRLEDDRTIPTDGATALAIDARVGDVTVRGEERDDLAVEMLKQSSSVGGDLSKLDLAVEREDGRLTLVTRYTGDSSLLGGTPTMDLTIRVPRSLRVAELAASVGDVRVEDVTGDLAVDSSVGDVTIENVDGAVTAEASTGDVRIEGASAIGDVRTDVGDLDLVVAAIDGDTAFESSTGDVDAVLSPELDAELEVQTSVGDVTVEGLSLGDGTRTESSASGTLGDGGPTLRVETSTGDVTLSAL